MMEVDETKDNLMSKDITEILLDSSFSCSAKLQALQSIKKIFKPPDKIFRQIKLEPLLQSAKISLEGKPHDKDFLFNYGISLIKMIGKYSTLDPEIIYQLEYILTELESEQSLTNELIKKLWNQIDNGFIFNRTGILSASKQIIENTVLDWLESTGVPEVELFAKMSSDSPKLFQNLTMVLYEVLVRTNGHSKVFKVQEVFIQSVFEICQKEGKNFLRLYPNNCRKLVALLLVSPKIYSEGERDVLNKVVSSLMEMFSKDRKRALILLSHFSEWVSVFKVNLKL